MKDLSYSIEFHSPWHCGSGLSAGADVDALVIKDKDMLPYVPGKTVKGLLREAVEEYLAFRQLDADELVKKTFGHLAAENEEDVRKGMAFFTNAELDEKERQYILTHKLGRHLFDIKASTRIDDNGVADDHSLRRIEVTVPFTLYGKILDVDDEMALTLMTAAGLIKRMGVNRNRGLGRCTFKVWEDRQ